MPVSSQLHHPEEVVSLYLHIPFCRHRCSYCDFNTYTSLGALKDDYAIALSRELEQVGAAAVRERGEKQTVHTIYFGGGTPSLMSPIALQRILEAVFDAFHIRPTAEITLEANPGTVDLPYLESIRELGINRLSLGMQSAVPAELTLLEREHDFSTVEDAVASCAAAGLANVSLDLIYGLPGQTMHSWEQSLLSALALAPKHLSLYCLTIEAGTPMQRWLTNGQIQAPDPDLAADMYELACKRLAERKFLHYEISNWALPGMECQHNMTYWRNHAYLGLGAGAHGQAGGYRYQVVKQPRVYVRRMQDTFPSRFPVSSAVAAKHRVGREEAMSDIVITQLRLLDEGLDLDAFARRFGRALDEAFDGTVSQLINWGLLHQQDGRLLLTERGRFLSNQVFYRFM